MVFQFCVLNVVSQLTWLTLASTVTQRPSPSNVKYKTFPIKVYKLVTSNFKHLIKS